MRSATAARVMSAAHADLDHADPLRREWARFVVGANSLTKPPRTAPARVLPSEEPMLDYDLNEYRAVMALHDAACEAWEAYADPARNSLTTIRVKNETHTALSEKVAALLRETYRMRGEQAVMVDVLRECDKVICSVRADAESADEDEALGRLLLSIKRMTLLRQADERDLLMSA